MIRTVVIAAAGLALLFLTGCGTAVPAAPAASTVSATRPAAASSGGAAAAPAAQAVQVDVTLEDNTIQSSLTSFKAGVPYRFVIVNNGEHRHNFNINTPADVAGGLDKALSTALLVVKQDALPLGGGTTVEYTFPATAVGKPLEFSCLIRRHYEDDMRLAITVTQ